MRLSQRARWSDDETGPLLTYEPVGLLDLPPGDRGYGQTRSVAMRGTTEAYNAGVEAAQRQAGSLPTEEPLGSRMRWGAWRDVEHRPAPEANE